MMSYRLVWISNEGHVGNASPKILLSASYDKMLKDEVVVVVRLRGDRQILG